MTGLTYPWDALPADGGLSQNAPSVSYRYDAMGRLTGMSGVNFPIEFYGQQAGPIGASAAYNSAGQLTSLSWGAGSWVSFSESRTYNSLHQLTRETTSDAVIGVNSGTVKDMQYIYTAGQNNGRVSQTIDGVTGENVTYQYDALNRLVSAVSTGSITWSQIYAYDGFGNLNGADPATNRAGTANGDVYDANGNYLGYNVQYGYANTYDVENRLVGTPGGPAWTYDPWGKRIAKNAQDLQNCEVYFYGITGQKLATFRCVQATDDFGNTIYSVQPNGYAAYNVYFGGRMLQSNGRWVVTDRLGSVRATATSTSISFVTNEAMAYFPYGVERTSTPDGREKFAGYIRDSAGQDYSDQRYYSAAMGRFLSPDPLGAGILATGFHPSFHAVHPTNPTTWNQYIYAEDDPINRNDPTGLSPDCDNLLSKINKIVFGDPTTLKPTKGLIQRFYEQIYGNDPPGTTSWTNHNDQISGRQKNLKQKMKEFNDNKCDPPSNWKVFDYWANKPVPTKNDYKGPQTGPNMMQWIFGTAGSYIFYQMLPALEDAFQDLMPEIEQVVTGIADSTITYGGIVGSDDDDDPSKDYDYDYEYEYEMEAKLVKPQVPILPGMHDGPRILLAAGAHQRTTRRNQRVESRPVVFQMPLAILGWDEAAVANFASVKDTKDNAPVKESVR
jgi:RHS repeat-associated protein